MPYAITHKRLGGYIHLAVPYPSYDGEPFPKLSQTLKPGALHDTREAAEAVRKSLDDFDNCYQTVEVDNA